VSVTYGSYDNQRAPFGGPAASATQRLWIVSARAQAAWLFQREAWAAKPRIAVGVHGLSMDGFGESGSNAFRVNVDKQRDTYVDILPAVDVYTEVETGDGVLVRPQLTLGLTQFVGSAAPAVTARFADAPPGVPSFTSRTSLDRTRVDAAASVTMFATRNLSVRAEVSGSFSRDTGSYGAGLKAALAF
jgi:outer membrane autotransporter protein